MRNGFDSSRYNSRSDLKNKKRKINRIYNILLGIVIVLIFIVGGSIFLGGSNEEASTVDEKKKAKSKTEQKDSEEDTAASVEEEESESTESESETATEENTEDTETEEEVVEENEDSLASDPNGKVEVESSGENVKSAYTNETWKPVGTTQVGEHSADFTKDGTDWNEMEKAIMYGAGLTEGSYTLWWLERGGNPTSQAIGTISPKDNSTTYRVYIDWIDGEGWKPTKVEELIVNDKKK
ncbi:YrrS family protein [Peribacillus acanthi]|uniref:YrrS family protein n=1 Tax=Peribacillus acanthi TaxID=2171554 RepID=UPI000D3E074A|nr:YrrS family protein [Peribacillus acanthi]